MKPRHSVNSEKRPEADWRAGRAIPGRRRLVERQTLDTPAIASAYIPAHVSRFVL
jgi:hypothetical protein